MSDCKLKKIQYSVVICSYNRLQQLKMALPALKNCNRDGELILVDDGSTDDTVEWAEGTGDFNAVYQHKNSGKSKMSSLRNRGVELSSFEHLILLDAECMVEPQYFNGHDIVFSLYCNPISIGVMDRYNQYGDKLISNDPYRKLFDENAPICSYPFIAGYAGNIAFQKSTWLRVGGFDTEFDGHWGFEEVDFFYRCFQNGSPLIGNSLSAVRHLHHFVKRHNDYEHNLDLFERKHGIKIVNRRK